MISFSCVECSITNYWQISTHWLGFQEKSKLKEIIVDDIINNRHIYLHLFIYNSCLKRIINDLENSERRWLWQKYVSTSCWPLENSEGRWPWKKYVISVTDPWRKTFFTLSKRWFKPRLNEPPCVTYSSRFNSIFDDRSAKHWSSMHGYVSRRKSCNGDYSGETKVGNQVIDLYARNTLRWSRF